MIVHEAPDNDGEPPSTAYRFVQDLTEAEPLSTREYISSVAASCLGAMATEGIEKQGDSLYRLLWALRAPDSPRIANRNRPAFERVVASGSPVNHSWQTRTQRLIEAAVAGQLTTAPLLDELRLLTDLDLTGDDRVTWVTRDGLYAYAPHNRPGDTLVARATESLSGYTADYFTPGVLEAVQQLGLTHASTQFQIRLQDDQYVCTARHNSLGIVNDEGRFEPYITVLNSPEAAA